MNNRYNLLLVIIGLLLLCIGSSTSQSLSSSEYNSVLWIARLYSSPNGLKTIDTICNDTNGIYCQNLTSGYHVTSISIFCSSSNVGALPSITSLDLPELGFILMGCDDKYLPYLYSSSINPLNMFRNLPKLYNLRLRFDPYITSPDFSTGFPSLSNLELYSCYNLTKITNFFNNSLVSSLSIQQEYLTGDPKLNTITIDPSILLPNLAKLSLDFTFIKTQTLIFTQKSFPKLDYLILKNYGNATVNIYSKINSSSIQLYTNYIYGAGYNLDISNNTNLRNLYLNGLSSVTPSSLNSLPSLLSYVNFKGRNISSFPFTTFPLKLSYFICPYCSFQNMGSWVFPKTFTGLDLSNNSLSTQINWSQFSNVSYGFYLNVNNNPKLTGEVPESFCTNNIFARNTGITSFPDCFWCYYGDTDVFDTTLPKPPNFTCNVTFESMTLYHTGGAVTIRGNNIGWGDLIHYLYPIIPNKALYFFETVRVGPPYIKKIDLDPYISNREYNFTILYVGINLQMYSSKQIVNGVEFTVGLTMNEYLNHTYTLTSVSTNQTYPMYYSSNTSSTYRLSVDQPLAPGIYFINVSNPYYYKVSTTNSFTYKYPIIQSVSTTNPFIQIGSVFNMKGNFGVNFTALSVNFNSVTPCTVISVSQTSLNCTLQQMIPLGYNNIEISVDGYTYLNLNAYKAIYSVQSDCINQTNNCYGNGACNLTGSCICKSSEFYQNCSSTYPRVTSGDYDLTDKKKITLYGDFGPYSQSNPSVKINDTNCIIQNINQQNINCTLETEMNYGIASATVNVDGLYYFGKEVINFIAPSSLNQQECEKRTSNCNNHGVCNVNGTCVCEPNYNANDDCFSQISNSVTYSSNQTTPNAAFSGVRGLEFSFQVLSIQELNYDGSLLQELFAETWNSTITASPSLTTGVYILNIPTVSVQSNTIVTAVISFAPTARDIVFGTQTIHINPNSIKMSLNITNWIFTSNLATLRVVFSTKINDEQFIKHDCKDREVDTFTNSEQSSSLKYLRVVKGNTQYNGRFIDFALSDGRMTYSRTEFINKTSIGNQQSNVLIGITLPQCRECVLDPDFTPLIIEGNSNNDNCDTKNNKWKITVGVVVGVGAIVMTAAIIFIIKKKRSIALVIDNIKLRKTKH